MVLFLYIVALSQLAAKQNVIEKIGWACVYQKGAFTVFLVIFQNTDIVDIVSAKG